MFNEATFREILLPSSGDDGRSISRNVASLNILVHDVINLLYHSGNFVGQDEEGNLYMGIVNFMIVSLKQSIPAAIRQSVGNGLNIKLINQLSN